MSAAPCSVCRRERWPGDDFPPAAYCALDCSGYVAPAPGQVEAALLAVLVPARATLAALRALRATVHSAGNGDPAKTAEAVANLGVVRAAAELSGIGNGLARTSGLLVGASLAGGTVTRGASFLERAQAAIAEAGEAVSKELECEACRVKRDPRVSAPGGVS